MFDQSNLFNILYIGFPLVGIAVLGTLIYFQRRHH